MTRASSTGRTRLGERGLVSLPFGASAPFGGGGKDASSFSELLRAPHK